MLFVMMWKINSSSSSSSSSSYLNERLESLLVDLAYQLSIYLDSLVL